MTDTIKYRRLNKRYCKFSKNIINLYKNEFNFISNILWGCIVDTEIAYQSPLFRSSYKEVLKTYNSETEYEWNRTVRIINRKYDFLPLICNTNKGRWIIGNTSYCIKELHKDADDVGIKTYRSSFKNLCIQYIGLESGDTNYPPYTYSEKCIGDVFILDEGNTFFMDAYGGCHDQPSDRYIFKIRSPYKTVIQEVCNDLFFS